MKTSPNMNITNTGTKQQNAEYLQGVQGSIGSNLSGKYEVPP